MADQVPKTLQELSFISKVIGLQRATSSLDVNCSVFKETFSDGISSDLKVLDAEISETVQRLKEIAVSHKLSFMSHCNTMLDSENKPTEDFLKVYLSAVYMTGGEVVSCLNFLTDFFDILFPDMSYEARIEYASNYAKTVVQQKMVAPRMVAISEDGSEVDIDDLDMDMGDDEVIPVTRILLSLTDDGYEKIKDVIEDIDKRKEKILEASKKLSLLNLESPSRMLN